MLLHLQRWVFSEYVFCNRSRCAQDGLVFDEIRSLEFICPALPRTRDVSRASLMQIRFRYRKAIIRFADHIQSLPRLF